LSVCKTGLVAQRLKRIPAIRLKLQKLTTQRLTQMQDIGGCRAIVDSIEDVKRLVVLCREIGHTIFREYDYISKPQDETGYRSHHFVYSYIPPNEVDSEFEGMRIEAQIPTRKQHLWATAVETYSTLPKSNLKAGEGDALTEGTTTIFGTPSNKRHLQQDIRFLSQSLNTYRRSMLYGHTQEFLGVDEFTRAYYWLIIFDFVGNTGTVTAYPRQRRDEAFRIYERTEKQIENQKDRDVVLVKVDSLKELSEAYPNYRPDIEAFDNEVKIVCDWHV